MKSIFKVFLSTIIVLFSTVSPSKEIDINVRTIGKGSIKVNDKIEISILDFEKSEIEGHLLWKEKLVVKKGSKVVNERYPIIKEYDENYFYYFVPIKNGKYLLDLNGDKNYEFAVVVDHGGNAPGTSVIILSLIGTKLKFYKHAWYQMEGGTEVIWDKKNVPKKCLFVRPGVCEYL